ncbi:MAG: WG repeat-containing protein [Chitinophagales bacterium]|jgi:hypothetical protein
MQRNYYSLAFFLFCSATSVLGQTRWIFPLTAGVEVVGSEQSIYFKFPDKGAVAFDAAAKEYSLPAEVKRGLGNLYFSYEKEGYAGIWEAGKGLIIPAAYQRIELVGTQFFDCSNYGARTLVNAAHEVLVDYTFDGMVAYASGDTLLVKYNGSNPAKVVGFLKNGSKIDEKKATAAFPTNFRAAERSRIEKEQAANVFSIATENRKYGIKNKEGVLVVPVEYDELKPGLRGCYAARKGKEWGYFQL